MSLRCGCADEGDDIVFGSCRKCGPQPEPTFPFGSSPTGGMLPPPHLVDPPRLIPSWVFTVPTEDPAEPRYMETLDDSCGDLG